MRIQFDGTIKDTGTCRAALRAQGFKVSYIKLSRWRGLPRPAGHPDADNTVRFQGISPAPAEDLPADIQTPDQPYIDRGGRIDIEVDDDLTQDEIRILAQLAQPWISPAPPKGVQ